MNAREKFKQSIFFSFFSFLLGGSLTVDLATAISLGPAFDARSSYENGVGRDDQ